MDMSGQVSIPKLMDTLNCLSRVTCVAFHPTAPLLATSSSDKTAKLWQLNYQDLSNSPCVATLEGHSNSVSSVAFHPTAPLLATGSADNTAKLWRLSSDNSSATCVATLEGHSSYVNSVAFHPTAPLLATGSHDNTAKLWRLSSDNSSATCVATLEGHSHWVFSVAFHPTAPLLATGSYDNTAKLWQLGSVINFILAESAFLFGFQKNLLNLFSVFSTINDALDKDKIKKPTHYLLSYDYREKKKRDSIILDPEKKIKLPDRLDHENRKLTITKARMSAMLVQKLLIDYKKGPPIDIFKFATSILSRRRPPPPPPSEKTLEGHSNFVASVAFHPTAPLLATGSNDKTAKLWRFSPDGSTATCAATLKGHSSNVRSVAFHPTAPLLATGSWDNTAKLWQLNYQDLSNSPCVATLEGQSDPVSSVAFHPTAPLLATGSSDKTAKLWKIKDLLSHINRSPQGGGSIIRHHKKRLSRKLKRYASKRIKKNRNRNKYQKSKKAKTKTKCYRKFR